MKLFVRQIFGILFYLLLSTIAVWDGLFREIAQPFVALPEKLQLLSYPGYASLLSIPVLTLGVITVSCYQLFHPKRNIFSYARWWNIVGILTVIVLVIALFNRAYLGYRVDQAGYVECLKETRTSFRRSWRTYAAHKRLCKSS